MLEGQAREVAEMFDGLFLDKVRWHAAMPERSGGAVDDLAALMLADATAPGFRDSVEAMLDEMRLALPTEIRDVLDKGELDT